MNNKPLANIKTKTSVTAFRSRWKWYFSGALVIFATLIILGYLSFVQASDAFASDGVSLAAFQQDLVVRLVKCLLLVLAFGLFWFFFAIQDYQTTFTKLLEKLSTDENSDQFEAEVEDDEASGRESSSRNNGVIAQADDLTLIETSVDTMLQENRDYAARLDEQQNLLRDNLILRLMKGWIQDGPLAFEMCRSLNLDLGNRPLQVLVFGLDETPESAALSDAAAFRSSQLLQQTLPQMFRGLFEGHTIEIEGMVASLILPLSGENLEDRQTASDLISIIKLAQDMVTDETQVVFRAALGSVYNGISGIQESFSEAVEMFQYSNLLGMCSRVSQYEKTKPEIDNDDRMVQLWARQEIQLMNCIDSEDFQRAGVILFDMLGSDYLRYAPTLELARYRLLNLTNMMVTMLGKIKLWMGGELFDYLSLREQILFSRTLPELRSTAAEVFATLDTQQIAKRQQSGYARMMGVIDYISDNYSDPNLSVAQIASHFELNPSYLSRTFKKLMDTGLADYIQHVRVKEARRLMLSSSVSVKEAAALVGYNSVLTMNRAFQKLEGTTAGRLRNHPPSTDSL
jgi:AraC-like DNA-binding protein